MTDHKSAFRISGKKRSVLLVEDEPINQEMMKAILADSYDVAVAGTGEEALSVLGASPDAFSIVLLDLNLPGKGGYFLDSTSVQFSVNNACADLDMTNEFMRFLITKTELNRMASVKRLITPSKDLSFDLVYAPIGAAAPELVVSPTALGIEDPLAVQIRLAAFRVGTGELTIDEAVAQYGTLK